MPPHLTPLESVLLNAISDSVAVITDTEGGIVAMNREAEALPEEEREKLLKSDESVGPWSSSTEAVGETVLHTAHSACPPGGSFEHMLNALSAALFDASVYVDSHFRFKEESPQLAAMVCLQSPLTGRLFKDLIATDQDRERFERYIESSFNRDATVSSSSVSTAASSGPVSVARTLEVIVGVDHSRLVNARLYVTPVRCDSLEGDFFVGVQTAAYDPLPEAWARPTRIRPTIPAPEVEPSLACITRDDPAPSVGEASESTLFEHPLSVEGGKKPNAPPHVSLVTMLYRLMNRDLVSMTAEAHVEGGWITPLYQPSDVDAMEEDLVKILPNALQERFLQSAFDSDVLDCCELLQKCTVGNLNVLSYAQGLPPTSAPHHFCAAARFILCMLTTCKPDVIIPFFDRWMQGYESLNVYCSSMRAQIALSMISCAIKFPDAFSSPAETEKLRSMFSLMVSTTDSFGVTDQARLPAVYTVCLLWASLQRKQGRMAEAVQILEGAAKDMELYSIRHPGSLTVLQLRAMTQFNLASAAIQSGDWDTANRWMNEINELLRTSGKMVLQKVRSKIMDWLRGLESQLPVGKVSYKQNPPSLISSILSSRAAA